VSFKRILIEDTGNRPSKRTPSSKYSAYQMWVETALTTMVCAKFAPSQGFQAIMNRLQVLDLVRPPSFEGVVVLSSFHLLISISIYRTQFLLSQHVENVQIFPLYEPRLVLHFLDVSLEVWLRAGVQPNSSAKVAKDHSSCGHG
jgi:hypothetical protein